MRFSNWIFNLSDIDQNIYKQAIQIKTGIVLKNLSRETQNDRNLCIVDYVMHTKN